MITNCKVDKNISSSEYDRKARELIDNSSYTEEEKTKSEVNKLLEEYLNKVFMTEGIKVY